MKSDFQQQRLSVNGFGWMYWPSKSFSECTRPTIINKCLYNDIWTFFNHWETDIPSLWDGYLIYFFLPIYYPYGIKAISAPLLYDTALRNWCPSFDFAACRCLAGRPASLTLRWMRKMFQPDIPCVAIWSDKNHVVLGTPACRQGGFRVASLT